MTSSKDQSAGAATPPRGSREWMSLAAIGLVMIIATGPGVLLVNRPETFLGLPLIYGWGILWYFVMSGIALLSDRFLWQRDRGDEVADGEGDIDAG
ncbi:MAG: hypothetical protein AAF191_15065 [Verrucomicrobiota bacterium]